MNIKRFILNQKQKKLIIYSSQEQLIDLNFEYLRVFSPLNANQKSAVLEGHKKHVQLTSIEFVGKHGYRLIFDDNHNAVYSAEYLILLATQYTERWAQYLAQLEVSGHSRESIIPITQLP
ncbi:MAG: gamma-butyrobetaine hydroxylase-like domain-containing protein [Litorilituus sp.]|nr:gamma-butyrobetaine hydroxylase-like domain-containing protein [Litorilituus sp.]